MEDKARMTSIEGNIINIDGRSRKRVEIADDGLIAAVGEPTGKADVVLGDELIFPGFIDLHVHARECADHSQDYKEDFVSAGAAAINGGVVAFADMPNNPVPPVDEKSYDEKIQLAKKSAVDVVLYAGIGPATKPLAMTVPYKVFMGKSVGELFFSSRGELSEALAKYRGRNVSFHCEHPEILEANKNQPTHALRRPPEAEVKAIDFALRMIEKYQLAGKICHLSTKQGLDEIIGAKKHGVNVTCEVTPHHVYFDNGMSLQMNPPLRAQADRLALIDGLRGGNIDFLATDHAPHTVKEKQQGISGLPHLDTYGPFVTWLMEEHRFTPADIARICSYNPGQFMNKFLDVKFGQIKQGFAGSLTVLDLNRPVKIEKSMLKTKCGWSPFEGVTFPGSINMTIVRGKVYKA